MTTIKFEDVLTEKAHDALYKRLAKRGAELVFMYRNVSKRAKPWATVRALVIMPDGSYQRWWWRVTGFNGEGRWCWDGVRGKRKAEGAK